MITMRHIFLSVFILIMAAPARVQAQGCVAIRSNGNTCSMGNPADAKGWNFNFNTRYFKSYKHFVGTIEQKERTERGTEVINHSLNWDFTFTRYLNSRWSLAFTIPVISNVRSSMYEHYGNNSTKEGARAKTKSFGIGDIRLAAYHWLFDPAKSHKGNLQVGMGIKLPTGDYQVTDYFHKVSASGGDSTVLGPVDQSIQLGDGGTGISVELNGFFNITPRLSFYENFYYLINPREQNGTSTARGGSVSATNIKYFTSTMSVPDQYMVRGGFNYMASHKLNVSGGVRIEAIPSSDLFGGDKGFRRPGIVISAEPTVSYMTRKGNFYLSVPVALQRNRTQSHADKLRSADTGNKVQGDAAFADYLVNIGFTVKL